MNINDCVTSESNLLFWRLDIAYFGEKMNKFLCPCWSRKEDGDPATRPATQINKITQLRTENTVTVLICVIISIV